MMSKFKLEAIHSGEETVKDYGYFDDMDGCYLKIQEIDGPDAMDDPQWPEGCDAVVTDIETGERWFLEGDAWSPTDPWMPVPKILILRQHYWGKADTIPEAWKQLSKVSGYTVRQLKREPWVMYSVNDYGDVPVRVDGMGSICHHERYPIHEIDSKLPKEKG